MWRAPDAQCFVNFGRKIDDFVVSVHFIFFCGEHWCFDLADADGRLIVTGDTLAVGVDLVGRYRYREVPPGILFVGRTDGAGRDPRPGEFLDGLAELYYLTSDDPLIGEGVP